MLASALLKSFSLFFEPKSTPKQPREIALQLMLYIFRFLTFRTKSVSQELRCIVSSIIIDFKPWLLSFCVCEINKWTNDPLKCETPNFCQLLVEHTEIIIIYMHTHCLLPKWAHSWITLGMGTKQIHARHRAFYRLINLNKKQLKLFVDCLKFPPRYVSNLHFVA